MDPMSPAPKNTSTTSAAPMMPRKLPMQGPCFLKMLVNNLAAGSIIGKNGSVITNIEMTTQVSMKLSSTTQYFPGTLDRVLVMSGEQKQINDAVAIVVEKLSETSGQGRGLQNEEDFAPNALDLVVKIVVPRSVVSGLIGKGGQQIKQMQEESGSKIQISSNSGKHPAESLLTERVVRITGEISRVRQAAIQIATNIQGDPHLKTSMNVVYEMPPMVGMGAMHGMGQQGSLLYGPAGNMRGGPDMMSERCEIFLQIPDGCIGLVIGRQGCHLLDITRSSGAQIRLSQKGDFLPGTENRKVTIQGNMAAVHHAHALFLYRLREVSASDKQQ
eukprot:Lankesteria_metandrocarpae@DN446_c0_g1_i1.p1